MMGKKKTKKLKKKPQADRSNGFRLTPEEAVEAAAEYANDVMEDLDDTRSFQEVFILALDALGWQVTRCDS